MRSLACRRFGRLLSELADREPTLRETSFLDLHRDCCTECRKQERAASYSLDMLRDCAFSTEVEDSFDRRVIRRARVQSVRDGFRYWSPAFTGGLVAAALLLTAVQVLTRPISPNTTQNVEVSRGVEGSLALKSVPPLQR